MSMPTTVPAAKQTYIATPENFICKNI